MNSPEINLPAIASMTSLASARQHVFGVTNAARVGVKMKAALEMVLMFHDAAAWTGVQQAKWIDLQKEAGIDEPKAEANSKVMCYVIRSVLGQEAS